MEENFFCACGNGLKCKGICRETNLFRKRTILKRCPSAHKEERKNKREEQIRRTI